MEISINTITYGRHILVAACDADLLGKSLQHGKVRFNVRKEFYGGSRVFLEEAIIMIKKGTIINLIGEQIVKEAIKHGLIHPSAIISISGITHVQIMR